MTAKAVELFVDLKRGLLEAVTVRALRDPDPPP
jgi:hypothetical protein